MNIKAVLHNQHFKQQKNINSIIMLSNNIVVQVQVATLLRCLVRNLCSVSDSPASGNMKQDSFPCMH